MFSLKQMWNQKLRLAALAVTMCGTALFGHHSFAAFDMTKTITLTGTVKEFQWLNPHSWIQMMVKDDSGKMVEWSIETGSPSSLIRQGWKPKILKAGDQVVVTAHPMRDGQLGASLVSVSLADGTKIGGNPVESDSKK